ncbi:ABC transporter permease [Flexithrix dorotheae]|uniref:ABC transporter permease n=1 Tax=Flexithrix dorotheae TaxID=70993 RepID=UPI00036458C3|nr:ABC transporter permease [Flexithrix dorotheae]
MKNQPPLMMQKFLRSFCDEEYLEEIEGDLYEEFLENFHVLGKRKAGLIYSWTVIRSFRPYLIKKTNPIPKNNIDMIRNYLIIAYRNFLRHKGYATINLVGLSFGMACSLLISLYLLDELRFDSQHEKSDQIYRVIDKKITDNGEERHLAEVGFNISGETIRNFAEVENAVKFVNFGRSKVMEESEENSSYQAFSFAEQSFFDVFDFPLLKGDRNTALVEPRSAVITEDLARLLFGDEDPMGKLVLTDRGEEMQFKITGVLANIPKNSHLQFQILYSFNTLKALPMYERFEGKDWSSNNFLTYLQVKKGINIPQLQDKLNTLVAQNTDTEENLKPDLYFQPLKKIHFYSSHIEMGMNESPGNIWYIYIFSGIGLFLILIASINYMNMATAKSAGRAREIGVRKVVGAARMGLIGQFITESLLTTFIALTLALGLVQLLLPFANSFTQKALALNFSTDPIILTGIFGVAILIGIISGLYPAFYLSSFHPVQVLKGIKINAGRAVNLRRALVVFQFTISIVMIVATLVAIKQMNYIQQKPLGFNKEHLLIVDINTGNVRGGYETIKNGYLGLATVKNVSVSSRIPGEWKNLARVKAAMANESGNHRELYFIGADANFLTTFEVELLQGRNFNEANNSDSVSLIINESAAKLLGVVHPDQQEVIISAVNYGGSEQPLQHGDFKTRIIGIVKDFHFQSLHEEVKPMIIAYHNNPVHRIDYFSAKITGDNITQTLASMEEILHKVDPGHLFEYHFLDEQMALFYEADLRRGKLFAVAAFTAIFIACLGLFALASFSAEQKMKEVGIRKVMGATVNQITLLLTREFAILVGIAFLIATPLSWFLMDWWLSSFAYKISLNLFIFLLGGIITLTIAIATVSFQSIKAAYLNPVETLRIE